MLIRSLRIAAAFTVIFSSFVSAFARVNSSSYSGKRLKRIVIRNATIVDGSGKPASGPYDVVIENDVIAAIVPLDPVAVSSGTPLVVVTHSSAARPATLPPLAAARSTTDRAGLHGGDHLLGEQPRGRDGRG